eukprot:Skav215455  [mRNA]  locus=scaffold2193:165266:166376:- [translate_table: standard]
MAFILENVDLPEEEDSNYSNIVKALSTAGEGFQVKTFKLCSTDYGTPQRRYRLFFVGFSRASQVDDAYMLPAEHPHVVAELERRADVKLLREAESDDEDQQGSNKRRKKNVEKEPYDSLVEKDVTTGTPKWKGHHIDLAEKRYMPKFGTFAKLAT